MFLKIFVKNVLFITLNMEVQCIVGLHCTNVVKYWIFHAEIEHNVHCFKLYTAEIE